MHKWTLCVLPTFVDGVDHLDLGLGQAGADVVDLDRGGVATAVGRRGGKRGLCCELSDLKEIMCRIVKGFSIFPYIYISSRLKDEDLQLVSFVRLLE